LTKPLVRRSRRSKINAPMRRRKHVSYEEEDTCRSHLSDARARSKINAPLYMYIYIHTPTYIYTYTHTHTHSHTHTHTHTHTHIHTHIYIHVYIYIHIYTHVYIYIHIYIHASTYIYTYTEDKRTLGCVRVPLAEYKRGRDLIKPRVPDTHMPPAPAQVPIYIGHLLFT